MRREVLLTIIRTGVEIYILGKTEEFCINFEKKIVQFNCRIKRNNFLKIYFRIFHEFFFQSTPLSFNPLLLSQNKKKTTSAVAEELVKGSDN